MANDNAQAGTTTLNSGDALNGNEASLTPGPSPEGGRSWKAHRADVGNEAAYGPMFWLILFTVFTGFFATNHEWDVSLADAFTSTADQMQEQAGGGSLKRRVAFLAIAGMGVLGLMLPPRQSMQRLVPLAVLMLVFYGWCMTSVLWSDAPSTTLRRCAVLTCLAFGALGMGRQLTLRELLHIAWIVPAVGLAIGLAAELKLGTFRPFSGDYRFSGTLHPNSQGMSLAMMCLALFCLCRDSQWKKQGYVVLFGIGLVFLVLTKSRTSFAGLLLAVTLLLTLRTASGWKWGVALSGLWVTTTAAVLVMLFNIDVRDQLTQMALLGRKEQAESLTGRLPLWTRLSEDFVQRPIAGYGYDSFWTPERIDAVSTDLQWGLKEAHNAYLETVLNLGLMGGILLLLIVFPALRDARKQYLNRGHPLFGFLFGMLAFGLLNGLTESGMVMPMFVPFVIATGLAQLVVVESRESAEAVSGQPSGFRKMVQGRGSGEWLC